MKPLGEGALFAGYAGGVRIDDRAPRPRDRHLPPRDSDAGVHSCSRCVLALIPDSNPSELCQFCARTTP